jgi:EAL domain-containing protein (putative c-di-GMP-specific phosphodiesterase class I)/ActR/RegA family two-component response regulator
MDFRSLRMLVIEDQTVQRKIAVRMLRNMGIQHVDEAEDGFQALTLLTGRAEGPDVVVSDLRMPGMDGIEFLRELGQSRPTTSVVLASALEPNLIGAAEAVARAEGLDVLGTLEKPLTPDKLGQVLRRYVPPEDRHSLTFTKPLEREELEQAIADGHIFAEFQPRVRISDNEITGAEALARWRHADRGRVPPVEFIPMAEQCGLIDSLTWVMLDQALAQASYWKRLGEPWTVSVNLSLHYLGYNGVADRISALAERHAVEPQRVVLEVTESLASTRAAAVIANLARLRMRGFGIAIDDYGTGYASLAQLCQIPFSELKVDRTFVHGAADRPTLRALLSSCLELARQLNLESVAEGVENPSDLATLRQLGCDEVQGYLIARPMPADALGAWIEKWTR